MARTTVKVEVVKARVNEILAKSTIPMGIRKGAMNVLESILFETGNYKGFRYLSVDQVPYGELPGINCTKESPVEKLSYEECFTNTDPTRVMYF